MSPTAGLEGLGGPAEVTSPLRATSVQHVGWTAQPNARLGLGGPRQGRSRPGCTLCGGWPGSQSAGTSRACGATPTPRGPAPCCPGSPGPRRAHLTFSCRYMYMVLNCCWSFWLSSFFMSLSISSATCLGRMESIRFSCGRKGRVCGARWVWCPLPGVRSDTPGRSTLIPATEAAAESPRAPTGGRGSVGPRGPPLCVCARRGAPDAVSSWHGSGRRAARRGRTEAAVAAPSGALKNTGLGTHVRGRELGDRTCGTVSLLHYTFL